MHDARRWIYGALDVVAAVSYALAIALVVPNRHPSAMIHLWSIPLVAAVAGTGMLAGGPRGWRVAVVGGSLWLASTFLLIVRICVSAAFLAGTYGAFGKATAMFALVMVALVIEAVGLLPLLQVKYLMTRAGRRAHGFP
jgi:hypothetical protein